MGSNPTPRSYHMDDQAVRDALEDHPAIEPADDGYRVTTADLENEITLAYGEVVVTVTMPDLGAVVVDDDPADVVIEGWFDALGRHLSDGYDVITSEPAAEAAITHGTSTVEVTYRLEGTSPEAVTTDAKALVDYVVGSYLQSAIPGYEYGEPMNSLLGRARSRGQS